MTADDRWNSAEWSSLQGACIDHTNSLREAKIDFEYMVGRIWTIESGSAKKHGLTKLQTRSMLSEQNYSCAVCGGFFPTTRNSICVDHNHQCCPGKHSCGLCVRGFICQGCNVALARLGDTYEGLLRAAHYAGRGFHWQYQQYRAETL